MKRKPKDCIDNDDVIPLIIVPLPHELVNGMKDRYGHYDCDHQFAEARLGNLIHGYYVGTCGSAEAGGEAMENYEGLFFSQVLPNRTGWCLHAAQMGNGVILRLGYLAGLTDDEPFPEKFQDETSWIFKENRNETWVHVFKDEICNTIEVRHLGILLCRICFSLEP